MTQPLRRRATYADLLALPESERAEIIDGEIVTHPAPRPRHSKPQRAIGHFVGGPFDDDDGFGGPGGWWIFVEVDIALGEDVYRPDLSGWRRANLPEPDVRPITVRPDWVCEVVSTAYEAHDRVKKRRLYAEHGIPHYWIVDPDARTLEALTLEGGRWVETGVYGEEDVARAQPFEAVEIPIVRLFLPRKTAPADE